MQAVRPQWEKIERDVKRTVVLSFIAGETPPKNDTPENKDLRAQKAMWAFIVQRFNDLGAKVDPKDENNVLMRITDDEHERIDRLYKLLGILNWLNDGNLDKIGDVLGNGYNRPGAKPPVTETKVADTQSAATTAAAPSAAAVATPTAAPTKREEFEQAVRGLAFKCGVDSAEKLTNELQAEFEIAGGLAAAWPSSSRSSTGRARRTAPTGSHWSRGSSGAVSCSTPLTASMRRSSSLACRIWSLSRFAKRCSALACCLASPSSPCHHEPPMGSALVGSTAQAQPSAP
jgi:hypothetical protein